LISIFLPLNNSCIFGTNYHDIVNLLTLMNFIKSSGSSFQKQMAKIVTPLYLLSIDHELCDGNPRSHKRIRGMHFLRKDIDIFLKEQVYKRV